MGRFAVDPTAIAADHLRLRAEIVIDQRVAECAAAAVAADSFRMGIDDDHFRAGHGHPSCCIDISFRPRSTSAARRRNPDVRASMADKSDRVAYFQSRGRCGRRPHD